MKKIILTLLAACLVMTGFSQTAFTLSGKIIAGPDTNIGLYYLNASGQWQEDTCKLVNGEFSFNGKILGPEIAHLTVYKGTYKTRPDNDPNKVSLFIEPSTIIATGSYNHIKDTRFTGSKSEDEYNSLQMQYGDITKEYDAISQRFDAENTKYKKAKDAHASEKIIDSLHENLENIRKEYEAIIPKYLVADRQFIITHPSSYVSTFTLSIDKTQWPADTVRALYNGLNSAIRGNVNGEDIQKFLDEIEDNSAGRTAKIFATADIDGKNISLAEFKGRYVLLDFWASWCVPCREGTPHLMELFKRYNQSGLDIVGISADDNVDAWRKAVNQDGVNIWHNVLYQPIGNKDKSKSITNQYGIHIFPTKILVGKDGIIIGRYSGTEENDALDKKLVEIFK
ncbi:MAG TPA: TlpA disulfide reductase family protein [Chitinophagaceae bacterium]|jgi:thiol-disulfide isomerase/thioredoxin